MRVAILLALLLGGCVASPPPAVVTSDPEPTASPATAGSSRFELVETIPRDPRLGQDFIVRARLTPPGFVGAPHCHADASPAPRAGGGDGGGGGWMNELEPYVWECRASMPSHEGFVYVLLAGRTETGWVLSDPILLWAGDRLAPPTRILAWSVNETGPVRYAAAVDVGAPGTEVTIAAVRVLRFDAEPGGIASLGVGLARDGPLRFRGEEDFQHKGERGEFPLGERHSALAYAYTVNDLGGVDVTPMVRVG